MAEVAWTTIPRCEYRGKRLHLPTSTCPGFPSSLLAARSQSAFLPRRPPGLPSLPSGAPSTAFPIESSINQTTLAESFLKDRRWREVCWNPNP